MKRFILLLTFVAILSGFSIGIFLCTYDYPKYFEKFHFIIKHFLKIFLFLLTIIVSSTLLRKKIFASISTIILVFFISLSYGFTKAKIRLDELIKTPTSNLVAGKVKVSFLNKIFIESSNKTIIVYLKNYDKNFTSIGSEVFIVGSSKHIYSYLTNRERYGYFLYLFENNTPYVIYSEEENIAESIESDSLFFKIVNSIRQDVIDKFDKLLPHTSFLSISLIIGDSTEISSEFRENIKNVGISHIFSVSGFHVGVIVGALVLILGIFRIPKTLQFIITTSFLVIYSYIVGLKPPVVRASILASAILLVRSLNLSPNYLNTTLITGIIMLLVNPFLSVDIGFILSFIAVISIILFTNYINHYIIKFFNKNNIEPSKIMKSIITLFSVSLISVIFTLPIIIIWFGSTSLTGILSSIALVPLSSLNITSGLISYITSLLSVHTSELMFRAVNLINLTFIIITDIFSKLSLILNFKIKNPLTGLIFLTSYYLLMLMIFINLPKLKR